MEQVPLTEPGVRRSEAAGAGRLRVFLWSSVGKKAVMAVTGGILVLFVIFHLLGNLQLFQGQEQLDRYSRLLRFEPALLWTVRIVLFVVAGTHVFTGTLLFLENRRARPVAYSVLRPNESTFASRTMIYSGLIVMGFIIYHLCHLTLGIVAPAGAPVEAGRVFHNVVRGFQDPFIAIVYILGQLLLFFHLSHGIQSLFQSLGLRHPRHDTFVKRAGSTAAFLIAAGNISMPLAVLLHLVK